MQNTDSRVNVGDLAPDFTLLDQNGEPFRLAQYTTTEGTGQPVVLFFYPKDFSPGCTAEACHFRDAFDDFESLNALVVGISHDSVDAHYKFMRKHDLPYYLLSDVDNQVRKLYGVPKLLGLLPGRVTYVLNSSGQVCEIIDEPLHNHQHVERALAKLRALPMEVSD